MARGRPVAIIAALVAVVLVAGTAAGPARADGDPASDVLASQALFVPQDAGVTPSEQAQLVGLLAAARHAGVEVRLAIIASPADLGSVTALWAAPQDYARFLAAELGLVYRGPVLVVMPAGYGLAVPAGGATAAAHPLDRLPAPSRRLGAAAIAAVQRVAAASGHALPNPAISTRTASGSSSAVPWLVFLLGAALIVLAWTASLRARPLSLGRRPPRPQGGSSD